MHLTVYTDYSLRLLMYLALKEDGLATIEEIAKSYDISKNHLMKVAHQLGCKTGKGNRTRRGRTPYRAGHGHRDVFRTRQRGLRGPAVLRVA